MSSLDFHKAKSEHILWKVKVRFFLQGKAKVDEDDLVSYTECHLGQWLYGGGLTAFGNIEEMEELEKLHIELHVIVKMLLSAGEARRSAEAERKFQQLEALSNRIIHLLNIIERRIKK